MPCFSSDSKLDRAYSRTEDAYNTIIVNPEYTRAVGSTLAEVTGQGDTSTPLYYYFDMTGYHYFSIQIEDVPGATGTNTYTLEATNQDDGTSPDSCAYQDVTSTLFSIVSSTSDAFWIATNPITFKYMRVKVERTGDGGANDGGWTIFLRQSW